MISSQRLWPLDHEAGQRMILVNTNFPLQYFQRKYTNIIQFIDLSWTINSESRRKKCRTCQNVGLSNCYVKVQSAARVRTLNMSIMRFIYFRLTNWSRWAQSLALEISVEKLIYDGKVATYRFKPAGTSAVPLWDPILDRSCYHNSSTGQVRSNSPQDIRLLQATGQWTYIRAFRSAFWFSQFGFKLLVKFGLLGTA